MSSFSVSCTLSPLCQFLLWCPYNSHNVSFFVSHWNNLIWFIYCSFVGTLMRVFFTIYIDEICCVNMHNEKNTQLKKNDQLVFQSRQMWRRDRKKTSCILSSCIFYQWILILSDKIFAMGMFRSFGLCCFLVVCLRHWKWHFLQFRLLLLWLCFADLSNVVFYLCQLMTCDSGSGEISFRSGSHCFEGKPLTPSSQFLHTVCY